MEILLIFPGFILAAIIVVIYEIKPRKPKNNIHFYVARDKSGLLYLHVGKPFRDGIEFSNCLDLFFRLRSKDFRTLGLNENDYINLKWEDEPIEVFLNLED